VGFFSLRSNSTNSFNTAIGAGALLANTADSNTATGAGALLSNTTGSVNTAYGAFALYHNTTGGGHTAVGYNALAATNASDFLEGNTAVGSSALTNDTDGNANTAAGFAALLSNTSGNANTAIGNLALGGSTTGSNNTAVGDLALTANTAGFQNTAIGDSALESTTVGAGNTAAGLSALGSNTNGNLNTAVGFTALASNTTGGGNTAIGVDALLSNTTGNYNIAMGSTAGTNLTTGDNNIDIGNQGVAGESGTIRIGEPALVSVCFIAGINGATASGGTPVYIDANGQLGTVTSSARFKGDIKPMDNASEVLFALQPVAFRYKKDIDPAGTPQFGLVAEDVDKVNSELVVRDKEGKPYSVRYDAVNAMLLNEFLKEHRKVEQLEKQIDALTAGLQKVSAQLEVRKPTPQTVVNNQ